MINIEREKTIFELNRAQTDINLIRANKTWFIAGRGTGKTTGGIAPYLLDCILEMPCSTGIMVANSFEQMYNRTLPPVIAAWTEMGFREWDPKRGGHYVIGKSPPEEFNRPYLPVLKPEKFIHWYNGTVIALISLAVKGSANALSVQFGSFDEVKFMKQEDVKEVLKVFRGNRKYFEDKSQYLSSFFATDKWADRGSIQWILNQKKLMDVNKVEVVKRLALEHNKLLLQEETEDVVTQKKELKKMLYLFRKDLVFYCESSAKDNIKVLGEKYFRDQKRELSDYEYRVAIENENPTIIEGPFYPALHEEGFLDRNLYDKEDYLEDAPLIIATDYQHSIAPVCVAQISDVIINEKTLNYIDSMFTLEPLQLSDAIELFCERYAEHKKKEVDYVFDHTAIGKKAEGDPDYRIVESILKRNGWAVNLIYTGQAPRHFTKYNQIGDFLKNKKNTSFETFINRKKNVDLITSLSLSEAVMKNGETKKSKKYEDTTTYPDFPQQHATHFSDVFDMIQWAVNHLKLIKPKPTGFGSAFR